MDIGAIRIQIRLPFLPRRYPQLFDVNTQTPIRQ